MIQAIPEIDFVIFIATGGLKVHYIDVKNIGEEGGMKKLHAAKIMNQSFAPINESNPNINRNVDRKKKRYSINLNQDKSKQKIAPISTLYQSFAELYVQNHDIMKQVILVYFEALNVLAFLNLQIC